MRAWEIGVLAWPLFTRSWLRTFASDKKGAIAVAVALMTPALIGVSALGVEVSLWTTRKIQLQRIVDAAAHAGALDYSKNNNARLAAAAAADLAELNGAVGGSRSWDENNRTLINGEVTVRLTSGLTDPSNTAIHVTVATRLPTFFGFVSNIGPSVNINASAVGEADYNPPACVFGIGDSNSSGTPVSTKTGSPVVTLLNCASYSNGKIFVSQGGRLSGIGHYATKEIESGGIIEGPRFPYQPLSPDPFAQYSPVQRALTTLDSINTRGLKDLTVRPSETVTVSPGNFSFMKLQGNTTFSPGIYYVTGDITVGSTSSTIVISGSGVTFVYCGSFSATGNAQFDLSAATPQNAQNGAIPGFLFITNSKCKKDNSFSTATDSFFSGAVYAPGGNVSFGGRVKAGATGSARCFQVVAQSISFSSDAQFEVTGCNDMGVPFHGPVRSRARVVQ